MDTQSLCRMTIAELAQRLAQREVSPLDVVAAHLAQIDALEPRLNCFITVCREPALEAARAGAESQGGLDGLAGIPVAVKDNVETAGVPSTAGSKILADYMPAEDAP